jgi:TM2 domain-containing membrane protein YozV/ribosomal protein L40E
MFCRHCGKEVPDQAVICVQCGVPPRNGSNYCHNCGAPTMPQAVVCLRCGVGLGSAGAVRNLDPTLKSKLVAGLLGIFVGGLGIHRFYLGYNTIAAIQLALALLGFVTCGVTAIAAGIWGLIEGILILVGKIDKDAKGNPLRD